MATVFLNRSNEEDSLKITVVGQFRMTPKPERFRLKREAPCGGLVFVNKNQACAASHEANQTVQLPIDTKD
jgi:hypothetical protein